MSASNETIEQVTNKGYEAGFVTDIEQEYAPEGLNEDIIRFISAKKEEPEWMLEWRLEAYRGWLEMEHPNWQKVRFPPIDFQAISYYAAPKQKPGSLDEVDPKLLETYEKLGIPMHERETLAGVERSEDEKPEVAGRFTDRILGGGRRLLYTLNTVMEFAELEAGNHAVNPQPFQLTQVIRSVANDFRERTQDDEVGLRVDVPESVGSVTLDQHAVERILVHLVHNATKFTDEGTVTISAQVGSDAVTLCVADTGEGIDPVFLPKMFDEFTQASTGYDRTHEGNGLGLTVVQRLVDRMEGTIDVESTPGEGTEVTVCLPLK